MEHYSAGGEDPRWLLLIIRVTSDDIRRTALSLFIECSRRGICPQPTETPDTAVPAEAEVEESADDLPF